MDPQRSGGRERPGSNDPGLSLSVTVANLRAVGEPAVVVEGLQKSFGSVQALRGIDLTVERGIVLGLLGPNGAGKTTAVRILTTLLKPTAGRATVLGHDVVREPAAVRSVIGLAGQS